MVRVISVHHFESHDVTTCPEPQSVASVSSSDYILMPEESNSTKIQVRDLNEEGSVIGEFLTIDPIITFIHAPFGDFVLALERPNNPVIRAYMNWRNFSKGLTVQRPRIAGAVSPSFGEESSLDIIEIFPVKGFIPTCTSVCPSTGNVIVGYSSSTLIIYQFCQIENNGKSYYDLIQTYFIFHDFSPTEIFLVEDIVGCLSFDKTHVFKIKTRDVTDERKLRSMSLYSFSSESDFASIPVNGSTVPKSETRNKKLNNITLKRSQDSETSYSGRLEGYSGNIKRHKDFYNLNDTEKNLILLPEIEEANKEILDVRALKVMDQTLGPFTSESTTVKLVWCPDSSQDKEYESEAVTLLRCYLLESELTREKFRNLKCQPVYWKKCRIRLGGSASTFSQPLHSSSYPHLMSVSVCFTSWIEGYLYHVPGHLRQEGKGCGVQKVATYPFTTPVKQIALEYSLMHALTQTGLETYTLKSGYYTVMEAESSKDDKINACPGVDIPTCLVGLRPFLGPESLAITGSRLTVISSNENKAWTMYNLKLPSHMNVYKDMIQVAEINQSSSPQGCSQLLYEAHILLRTWMHRLTWDCKDESSTKLKETIELYKESCKKLAGYLIQNPDPKQYKLALPYFRMSEMSLPDIFHLVSRTNGEKVSQGLLYYISQIVLHPTPKEDICNGELSDKIINILGNNDINKLSHIVLHAEDFRSFKTKKIRHVFQNYLRNTVSLNAEDVLAFAVLDSEPEDNTEARKYLRKVPSVSLSEALIDNYGFLLEKTGSSTSFSDLSILVRDSVPGIFVEVLVSLIKSDFLTLGFILELFASSGSSPDSPIILQLFLETYFVEYLEKRSDEEDVCFKTSSIDHETALSALIRSYLSCLASPTRFGDKNIDSDIFGPRDVHLEMLPPFQSGGAKETLLDAESPEFWCQNSLLKLQSLLCCDTLLRGSPNCKEKYWSIVLDFLEHFPDTVGALSLKLLVSEPKDGVEILAGSNPGVLLPYCKEKISEEKDWGFLLETLQERLGGNPNHPYHEEWYSATQEVLHHLAQTMSLESFVGILPASMQTNEDYQGYVQMCRKIQQAHQLQELISSTGTQLLSSLTL